VARLREDGDHLRIDRPDAIERRHRIAEPEGRAERHHPPRPCGDRDARHRLAEQRGEEQRQTADA
jgi:hypothetical protein